MLVHWKFNPDALERLWFHGEMFQCRRSDLQAVHEVLVDEEYAFLAPYLKQIPEPKVLDIGTHIGTLALWTLAINPWAEIIGIEADPDTYAVAKANAERKRISGARWSVFHCAASRDGNSEVRISIRGPSMSHRIDADGEVSVRTIGLGDALSHFGDAEVDLMKVDIEGAEELFLCSTPEYLSRIKLLVVELHPTICDTDQVRRTLSQYFGNLEEIPNRTSNKPLIVCSQLVA